MSNCGVNLRFIASLLRQTCAASRKKKANLSGETVDFTVKFQPVACFSPSRIFRFKILRFEWKNTVRSGILFCSKKRQRKLRRVLDQVSLLKKWEVCPPKKSGGANEMKGDSEGFPTYLVASSTPQAVYGTHSISCWRTTFRRICRPS